MTNCFLASDDIIKNCEQKSLLCRELSSYTVLIHELNSRCYKRLKTIRDKKMASLCETNHNEDAVNNSPRDAVGRLNKLVVTIPADIPLTDAEKSVLSKGLSFVPVGKTTNEYQVKDDCERLTCNQAFFFSGERESLAARESAVGRREKKTTPDTITARVVCR